MQKASEGHGRIECHGIRRSVMSRKDQGECDRLNDVMAGCSMY